MTEHTAVRTDAPVTGLSHVQLLVSDVGASAEWYTRALGLEPYAGSVEIGYVALRHRGAKVVVVLTKRPAASSDPVAQGIEVTTPISETLDHLAFAVSDEGALRAWADHLSACGLDHPGVVLENGNPSLQLRDPDGIAIELVASGPPPN
ncbi:MAG TPA: VOC family protein [Acidimicrobiales bacterium]|nr:VOC family protein [Acidimicrobiales bacterium]